MTADYNTACCHSAAQLCPTLFNPMGCSRPVFPAITVYWSLLKLMSIESMMPPNHLNLLPSIFPIIRVFSNESAFHIRWPKYWSFSFSISPFNEYSELCVRVSHSVNVGQCQTKCLTLCHSAYCSPPGSPVHGIFQARMLEWVAIPFSRESSQPKDRI